MGEKKFKNCCKIVSMGLDVWASASIDIESFQRNQGKGSISTDSLAADIGGFLNTFYHTLSMKGIDELIEILKEFTAATSAQNREQFAVNYMYLPLCFREHFTDKFPSFWRYVSGQPNEEEAQLVSPTVRRSPRKHSKSLKSAHSPSPRPKRANKSAFSHCEVAEDDPSDNEAEVEDGGDFEGTDKEGISSKTTTPNKMVAVSLSQVDLQSLSSTSIGIEPSSLKCYEDTIMEIPPVLAQSWSMKFFPQERQVPFQQHPQHETFKKAAIVNASSMPQPGDSAVSCRFQ